MNKSARSFPRPLSQLLGSLLSDVVKAQGFASTEIIARWADIVGTDIAAHSEPIKINWPRPAGEEPPEPATLVLRVEGPVAIEIQHLSAVILERVNRFFGWQAIGRLALRQAPLRRREPPAPPFGPRSRSGRPHRRRPLGGRRRRPAPGARPPGRRHQAKVSLSAALAGRPAIATIMLSSY